MKKSLLIFLAFTFSILHAKEEWGTYKEQTFVKMKDIPGWCSKEKADFMMNLIKDNKCSLCVEIGVYAGCSLFPIARALQYQGSGILYGIDAWDAKASTRGMLSSDKSYLWWSKLDYNDFYAQTMRLVIKNDLHNTCHILRLPAMDALQFFAKETIDFIHFDGNTSEAGSLEEITAYFDKVKDNGLILVNNTESHTLRPTLIYLLERSELLSTFEPSQYLLFRKNRSKTLKADELVKKPTKPIKSDP